MQPTIESLTRMLPENAFDATVQNYVLRYRQPSARPEGYATARFLAASFLRDVQAAAPDVFNGWQIVDYEREQATDASDRAGLTNGKVMIWASTRGYGVNAHAKVEFMAYAYDGTGSSRNTSKSLSMAAALSRPAAAIARDLARRIVPALNADALALAAKVEAQNNANAAIENKAAQLTKRYTDLKISADIPNGRVLICTKYGARVGLDAYIRRDEKNGREIWPLRAAHGCISCDDIDAPAGRALLKLVNGN